MRVLLLLVLALASSLSAWAQEGQTPRALQSRFTTSAAFLELNGKPVGTLKSFSGGNAIGEVVTTQLGSSRGAEKHLGNVSLEPIVLEIGGAMTPEFWAILQQWPNAKPLTGAILIGDFNQNLVKRLDFSNAIISEIAFPALDAASKEAFSIQVTLTCETIRTGKGSGKAPMTNAGKSRAMTTGNFRLSLDGVDTARVNKIESFVLKQKVMTNAPGAFRRSEIAATTPEFGDLVFTVSEAGAESLQGWFDSFVIQGKRTQADEKSGKIELLSPDLKTVVFSITLRGLGIYRFAPDAIDAGRETLRTAEARLYVESATIDPIK